MKDENKDLNEENIIENEDFEMKELSEEEESDVTGGGSLGKNGYSEFYINLPVRPNEVTRQGIPGASVTLSASQKLLWKYRYDEVNSRIIISIWSGTTFGAGYYSRILIDCNISYFGVDHVQHNVTRRLRFTDNI